eukprot:2098991-Prymnesium_polylepis.1
MDAPRAQGARGRRGETAMAPLHTSRAAGPPLHFTGGVVRRGARSRPAASHLSAQLCGAPARRVRAWQSLARSIPDGMRWP